MTPAADGLKGCSSPVASARWMNGGRVTSTSA
jgi:hypothetical protein